MRRATRFARALIMIFADKSGTSQTLHMIILHRSKYLRSTNDKAA